MPTADDDNRTLSKTLVDARTRLRVLNLAVAGWSESQIAVAVNLPRKLVWRVLDAEVKRCDRLALQGAQELRRLELLRLDELLKSLWELIERQGAHADRGRARAIEVALKVCESRRKLLGLDAPEKHDYTVDAAVERLTPAELAAEGRRLGLPAIDVTVLSALPLPGQPATAEPAPSADS
jgi:hypothetical protein